MWKEDNALALPRVLSSEEVSLRIYENKRKILDKSFYTKIGFSFKAKKDSLYRMKVKSSKGKK